MAVYFYTSNPTDLLASFDARISQKEAKGKIVTWQKKNGRYTHIAENWAEKAWFKPVVETNRLTFNIIKPENTNVNDEVYAYYHGHLIETFLNHFDEDFSTGAASALATRGDFVKAD
jgi:hypothetical protein